MENFKASNENIETPLAGKKIDFDWEEIKKGILESKGLDQNTNQEKIEAIPVIEHKIEIPKIDEEDSLEEESMDRRSFSEIVDSQQVNEAKNEVEEMFSTFSGETEVPKEFLQKQENDAESWNRPSGTEIGFDEKEGKEEMFINPPAYFEIPKEPKLLESEDQEELINRPIENIRIEEVKALEGQEELKSSKSTEVPVDINITEKSPPPKPIPSKNEVVDTPEIINISKSSESPPIAEIPKNEIPKPIEKTEEEKLVEQLKERLEELKIQIEKKELEINNIVPGLLSKFGLSEKSKKKELLLKELEELEKEKSDIEKKLGITPSTKEKKIKTFREKFAEKVYDFIRGKKEETKISFEQLPPEKKILFTKFISLAKDRRVQVAVVGAVILGVSVTVPPVGGAAWLTHGLVTGFLPAEYGVGLIYTGIATGAGTLGASGVGSAILRKIIENRKKGGNREMLTEEEVDKVKSATEKEITEQKEKVRLLLKNANIAKEKYTESETLAKSGKPEDLENAVVAKKIFEDTFLLWGKEMYSLAEKTSKSPNEIITEMFVKKPETPEIKNIKRDLLQKLKDETDSAFSAKKTITNTDSVASKIGKITETSPELSLNEKLNLIKGSNSFDTLYSSLERLSEEGIDPEAIKNDVEHIREIIRTSSKERKEAEFMADCFTGDISEQDKKREFEPKISIPERYGINDKINYLLKKEILETKKEILPVEVALEVPETRIIPTKESKPEVLSTFEDLYERIKERPDKDQIIKKIESIRQLKKEGGGVNEMLTLFVTLPEEYKATVTDALKKDNLPEEGIRDFSKINSFDQLYKTGLTEDEKADIRLIRLGQKTPNILTQDLKKKVSELINRDTQVISEASDLSSLYKAIDIICRSSDTQNAFSSIKIRESIQNYLHPSPQYYDQKKTLEEIPEIYGIRKKVLELTKQEEETEKPLTKIAIEKNPEVLLENNIEKKSVPERIAKIVSTSEQPKKEGGEVDKLEKILTETSSVEEFRNALNELGEDGDALSKLLEEKINGNDDIKYTSFPEKHGIQAAAIRIGVEKM
ncbi:hypothetical protein M0Q03_00540 [bacterium]|jgi:hypothetical protein|nr:hypothetical protein [bacterium]